MSLAKAYKTAQGRVKLNKEILFHRKIFNNLASINVGKFETFIKRIKILDYLTKISRIPTNI